MTLSRSPFVLLPFFLLSFLAAPLASQPANGGPTTLEMYDISDLSRPLETLNDPQDQPPNLDELTMANAENLARFVQNFITPAFITGTESVKAMGKSTLVALARREQHVWIQQFLAQQRLDRNAVFLLETRLLRVEESELEVLGIHEEPTILPEESDAEDFLDRVEHSVRANVISAPKLLIHNRQEASISVGKKISYIKEYAVATIEPGNREIVSPMIENVHEGIFFEGMVVTLIHDMIGLDFKLTVSEVDRPISTRQTEHGEIGLPIFHTTSLSTKMVLRDKATLLFPTQGRDEDRTVLMVTVKKVDVDVLRDLEEKDRR